MSDVSRVLFPADHNSVLALLPGIYQSRGELASMVIPKRDRPCYFTRDQAAQLARDSAIVADEINGKDPLLLIANGSYQLGEMLRVCERLKEAGCAYRLVYLQEPGRFRAPRDQWELEAMADEALIEHLFPETHSRRILLTHMRPEVARGVLWPIFPDTRLSGVLGYRNRGGTFDEAGMLFANRSTWGNVLASCARVLNVPRTALLTVEEAATLAGRGDPHVLR